jgi:hypothetical protein
MQFRDRNQSMIEQFPPYLQSMPASGLIGINQFGNWTESFYSIKERNCWLASNGYLQSNAPDLAQEWLIVTTRTALEELINIELLIDRTIPDEYGRPYKFSGWEFPAKDLDSGFWRSVSCFCNEVGWFYRSSIGNDFAPVPKDVLISPSYSLASDVLEPRHIVILGLQQQEVA